MSTSGTHHDKAKKSLSDGLSPPSGIANSTSFTDFGKTQIWTGVKIFASMAYSLLSISQQALYIAQNTRDIGDELANINDTLNKKR